MRGRRPAVRPLATPLCRITSKSCIRPVVPGLAATQGRPPLRFAGSRPRSDGVPSKTIARREQGNGAHGEAKFQNVEKDVQEGQDGGEEERRQGEADRPLVLADAERLQDLDHAGGVPAALHPGAGEHRQRRAVQAGVPEDRAQQPDAGDRRSTTGPAGGRSRFSSPARSCNISAARPASSIPPTSAAASRSTNGCSGRWAGLGPMAGQAHHFRTYRARDRCNTPSGATPTKCNRLYGVMNARLADREFLAGRYSIADMACIGWVTAVQAPGPGHRRTSHTSSAGCETIRRVRRFERGMEKVAECVQGRHSRSEGAGGAVRSARAGGLGRRSLRHCQRSNAERLAGFGPQKSPRSPARRAAFYAGACPRAGRRPDPAAASGTRSCKFGIQRFMAQTHGIAFSSRGYRSLNRIG